MARKSQTHFSAALLVEFKFADEATYSQVRAFLTEAKDDISKLFADRVEIEIGKVRLEKRTVY